MVKIKGPLHSVSASGSVAGNLTFSQRKSGQQARWQKKQKDYINPARQSVRNKYARGVNVWRNLQESAKEEWKVRAIGKGYTGYNLFIQSYMENPDNYIIVTKSSANAEYFDNPESNLYGKTYFYVMQYQARDNGGVPQSTGAGLPWVNISQIEAKAVSEAAGYHLMTNWEWMAIARDIEQIKSNWTGGSIGSGMIKRGNVGIVDAGSYDGANPETGILNDKAKLKLSNGEEIYHFSGNVWEWVDAQIPTQADMKPTGRYWPGEIKDVTDWGNSLAYSEIGPKDNTLTRSNGVGGIYYNTTYTSNRAFLRGGFWLDSANAGVFALRLSHSPTNTYSYIGFRCAR